MSNKINPGNLIDILHIIEKYEGEIVFNTDFFENGYIQFINIDYKKMDNNDFIFLMKRGCFLWEDPKDKMVYIMLG